MANLIANIVDGKLMIEIPLNETLIQSSTGKTLLVASVGRQQKTDAFIDGKPVYITLNAFVYP